MKEGCGRQNGMKLSLLMHSHISVCNTTMVGFDESGHTMERMLNSYVIHRHTDPAPGIMGGSRQKEDTFRGKTEPIEGGLSSLME
ncbi:uncharacterized protein TNCV_1547431 [Trichonephila clavipes]|nr:uncharacterized protein TNCV_1547431 [Trichonephila clavipes]